MLCFSCFNSVDHQSLIACIKKNNHLWTGHVSFFECCSTRTCLVKKDVREKCRSTPVGWKSKYRCPDSLRGSLDSARVEPAPSKGYAYHDARCSAPDRSEFPLSRFRRLDNSARGKSILDNITAWYAKRLCRATCCDFRNPWHDPR